MKISKNKKNESKFCDNKLFLAAALSCTAILVLSGCAHEISPQPLGISDVKWQTYDKAKQLELLDNYRRMQAENAAEDKADRMPEEAQNGSSAKKENTTAPVVGTPLASAGATVPIPAPKTRIEVTISGGTALMPPFTKWQPFSPVTFTMQAATCEETLLTQLDGKARISLRSCYKDNMLRLDPSRFDFSKKEGTVTIPHSSLWEQNFVYHGVNSDGYVKLRDVNVAVKQIN